MKYFVYSLMKVDALMLQNSSANDVSFVQMDGSGDYCCPIDYLTYCANHFRSYFTYPINNYGNIPFVKIKLSRIGIPNKKKLISRTP